MLEKYPEYIEDIYFCEVNTKYISSSVLKTAEFLRVQSTSKNSDVFNSRDEINLVFTINFSFLFYTRDRLDYMQCLTQ